MYAYDENDNIRRKRSLMEGTTLHQPLNRSLTDQPKSNSNATVDNPYFENDPPESGAGLEARLERVRMRSRCSRTLPSCSVVFMDSGESRCFSM